MSNSQIIIAFILNQEEGLHSLYIPSLTTKRLLLFHNVQSSITLLQTVVKYGNNLSRCIFSTAFSTLTHVRMCAVSTEEVQIFHCPIFTTRMRIGFSYKCSSGANFIQAEMPEKLHQDFRRQKKKIMQKNLHNVVLGFSHF